MVVPNDALRDELEALTAALPWVRLRPLTVVTAKGDLASVLGGLRSSKRDAPIGVFVTSESAVLAALSAGADEAAVLPESRDAASLTAFVDRTELRAQLRLERMQHQQSVARSERLLALGTLVAGVGHEINNPLSALSLSTEVAAQQLLPIVEIATEIGTGLRRGIPPSEDALRRLRWVTEASGRAMRNPDRLFCDISHSVDVIASVVRDLRMFAPAGQDEPAEVFELGELLDRAVRLVGRDTADRSVIERDYTCGPVQLLLPRGRIMQVVVNILVNALHAIREVERPHHRVRVSTRCDEDFVAVVISDTGPGIPPASIERIFDPFYTTKRHGLGTGLGLSISRSILRQVGGELSVESVYGDGATFMCFVPLGSGKRSIVESLPVSSGVLEPSRTLGVLIVDGDEQMLNGYARLLDASHRVLTAQDGRDAIELLESGSHADIAIVELDLPVVDGVALLDWLRDQRPSLARRTIVVTGSAAQPRYAEFLEGYKGVVVHKPVRARELIEAIRRVSRLAAMSTLDASAG